MITAIPLWLIKINYKPAKEKNLKTKVSSLIKSSRRVKKKWDLSSDNKAKTGFIYIFFLNIKEKYFLVATIANII